MQFDRRELGVELVKDVDVMPIDPNESLPSGLAVNAVRPSSLHAYHSCRLVCRVLLATLFLLRVMRAPHVPSAAYASTQQAGLCPSLRKDI